MSTLCVDLPSRRGYVSLTASLITNGDADLCKGCAHGTRSHRLLAGRSQGAGTVSRVIAEGYQPRRAGAWRVACPGSALTARFGSEVEAWFDELPGVLAALARRWQFELGSPIPPSSPWVTRPCGHCILSYGSCSSL